MNKRTKNWDKIIEGLNVPFYSNLESYIKSWESVKEDKEGNPIDRKWVEYKEQNLKDFMKAPKNQKFLDKQNRFIAFTIHNPMKYFDTFEEVGELLRGWNMVKNHIYSLEVGRSGRSLHLQCYLEFTRGTKTRTILNKLKTPDIHIETRKGSKKQNYEYITKPEAHQHGEEKLVDLQGDWDLEVLLREDKNVSEFVDFLLKAKLLPTKALADKYCVTYRNGNNDNVMSNIGGTYNDRKAAQMNIDSNGKDKNLPNVTFMGESGSGKSVLSKWLINQLGYDFKDHVLKKEANAHTKKLWFTPDAAYKPVAYFSEINYYFPNRTNLLSLLDQESPLEIKSAYIDNTFDLLIMNTTAMTPQFIYGISQPSNAYSEIIRRVEVCESQYFVLPNPLWKKMTKKEFQSLTRNQLVEQYPPKIYKIIQTPEQINIDIKQLRTDSPITIWKESETEIRVDYTYEKTNEVYDEDYKYKPKIVKSTHMATQQYFVEEVDTNYVLNKTKSIMNEKPEGFEWEDTKPMTWTQYEFAQIQVDRKEEWVKLSKAGVITDNYDKYNFDVTMKDPYDLKSKPKILEGRDAKVILTDKVVEEVIEEDIDENLDNMIL